MLVKRPAATDLVIAVLKRRARLRQQCTKMFLPLLDRLRTDSFVIEVKKVEQEKDKSIAMACV